MTGNRQQDFAAEVAAVTTGALHAVLGRAAELGVEVTPEQVANLVPNLTELSGELLAHARSHNGSLDGVELTFVPTEEAAGAGDTYE